MSKNQVDALSSVIVHLNHATLSTLFTDGDRPYPLRSVYLRAFPFFPLVFFKFLTAKGYKRKTYGTAFHDYWATYGHYLVATRLLQRLAPSVVLVANDHLMWTRTLVQAAQEQDIPTCYLQHASVTENFPPLSFDYALLDGADALAKYEAAGPSSTRVFLTGTPKFDRYHPHINTNEHVGTLGLCTNQLDPIPRVRALCAYLRAHFPDLPIVLRPHPGDHREALWQRIIEDYGMAYSDAKDEMAYSFLQGVDAIVAGDSNVLLEAVLMNVVALHYDFAEARKDYYGFIRNGLVDYTARPEQVGPLLLGLCQHKPSIRSRARYYCATVDTPYDGQSTEVAAALICQIAQGEINENRWQRAPTAQTLDAYELEQTGSQTPTCRAKYAA